MKPLVFSTLLSCALVGMSPADESTAPPVLEFASGLPGKQVHLSWPSQAGLRYRVEKSSSLGSDGGGWTRVAMVEADGNTAVWVDPEATTTRAFYRVSQPEIEVSAISPPLLSSTGGTLRVHGQCIPPGSFLKLEIEGQAPLLVALEDLGGGVWGASISAPFVPGGAVISAAIVNGSGITLLDLNQPITVTETGRAEDSPPALPPAAPMAAPGDPVPGIGITVSDGRDNDCDGLEEDDLSWASAKCAPAAAGFSKKGYDYYQARSDNAAASLHTNPYFASNEMAGSMVCGISPSPSGLPGEVSFQSTAISLPCPAGPPLAWTCTYRSMKPVSSGLGAGWDFSYNISIEPLPAADGSNAPRLLVHDGGGRSDVFHRQPDGTYRCDGMFREGSFTGDVFTLTFADQGTWKFSPLSGSPASGKITSITDRNGVALTCAYDAAGQLASVSDAFDRSLLVEWDTVSPPRVASVSSAQTGGAVFAKVAFSYSPNDRRLTAASAPFVPGQAPVAGAMAFSYSSGSADPRLNDNLISITDGAGRLLDAFLYSNSTTPGDIAYDTCSSYDRNRIGSTGQVCRTNFALLLGGYTMTENDELGRVCETVFDTQHRVVSFREYTGFATPGVEVTESGNRPVGKLRAGDPDFFETTCKYNADSRLTVITHPDGSRKRVTYERDLKPDCPVRERGNARVVTIEAPGGESRTVSCDYLPGYGSLERDHSGQATGKRSRDPSSGLATGRRGRDASSGLATGRRGRDTGSGLATGRRMFSPILSSDVKDDDCDGFVTRMTSSLGQTSTWTYDGRGNCTGALSPLPGRGALYEFDTLGRCSSVTTLNGPASSFRDELNYDGDTGFLLNLVCDSTGLQLTTACERDEQGRVTRVIDPRGNDWLFAYNPLHQRVSQSSPAMPARITTTITHDAGSLVARCDTSHLSPDGSPVAANPSYTTFYVHDLRGRLIRVAAEELPVDAASLLEPDPATLANFAVCDIGYDDAGQAVSLSTPAACRAQSVDQDCDFTYDERGLLHRCIAGGQGNPAAVTTEFDYDSLGALTRCATLGSGVASPETLYQYDGFHRLSSVTDPMGNVTTFDYANDGMVTRSVYGEVNDLPGSAGNVLLSRASSRSFPISGGGSGGPSGPGGLELQSISDACYSFSISGGGSGNGSGGPSGPSGLELQSISDACYSFSISGGGSGNGSGGPSGPGGLELQSISDACYSFSISGGGSGNGSGGPSGPGGLELQSISDACYSFSISGGGSGGGSGPVFLTLDGVDDVCYDIPAGTSSSRKRVEVLKSNKKGDPNANRYDFGSPAFFALEVEDDTIVVERFSPGDAGPHATETTVVDRSPAGLVQSVTRNGDLLLSCSYDSAGRPASCSNGASTITTTRDAKGNVTLCGKTDHFLTGGGSPDKTFSVARVFDPLGRCIQTTDGIGNVAHFAYDSLGRCVTFTEPGGLVLTTEFDSADPADPFSARVSGDFNGDGSVEILSSSLTRCGALVSSTDSYGHATAFTRDSLGRATRCDYPDGTFETWTYDSLGRNIEWVCQDSSVRTTVQDLNGRPLQVSWSNPQGVAPSSPTSHQWDGLGRCMQYQQGASTVVCAFDSLGNPVSDTSDGFTVNRSFDHRGRTGITYPDGTAFVETRTPLGLPLSVSALDATGGLITPPVVAMEYAGERVWRSAHANGVVTTCVFRADGEDPQPGGNDSSFNACVRVTTTDASQTVLSDTVHRRDANQREIRCDTLFTSSAQGPGRSQIFTRDSLGRVTGCVTQRRDGLGTPAVLESDVAYTLDLEGRRLTATGGNHPGSYTQAGTLPPGDQQMGQYTTWPGGPLTWDAQGNLASFTSTTGQLDYQHDAEGRLLALSDPATGTPVLAYAYDALGRRSVRDNQTGKITRFVYDGDVCIQEIGPDSNPDATFVCVDGTQQAIIPRSGDVLYAQGKQTISHWGDPHENLNGKHIKDWKIRPTTLVTDAEGAPTERFDFDDAGGPIFLEADGSPSLRTSAIGPIRWMAPEAMWESGPGLFLGGDGIYSPPLGMTVSRHHGHVTVLKSPVPGGGHVTVLKISAGGGGGGSSKAQDHNSTRSNKTAS